MAQMSRCTVKWNLAVHGLMFTFANERVSDDPSVNGFGSVIKFCLFLLLPKKHLRDILLC